MIVIGTDTHKQSHTAAALEEGTGRVIAEQTVRAKRRSFDDLLLWGRRLDSERVWAIEDCATSPARSSDSCWPAASESCASHRS